jgi:hypothetical protein
MVTLTRSVWACACRWCNQLDPTVSKLPFSEWEQAVIVRVSQRRTAPSAAQFMRVLSHSSHHSFLRRRSRCTRTDGQVSVGVEHSRFAASGAMQCLTLTLTPLMMPLLLQLSHACSMAGPTTQ